MKAEDLTIDNASETVSILGLRITYWKRVTWRDGFFQPPHLEVWTRSGKFFSLRLGKYHPWGPTTEIPTGDKS